MEKFTLGYMSGVFDLFHIGHLNIIKNAKSMCDKLIVGVTVDELVKYKNKRAVIPYEERSEIIRSLKYVDVVIPQYDLNKIKMHDKIKFDFLFVGDDWHDNEKWVKTESTLIKKNVKVIYFPYYKGTSSTLINETLLSLRK